MPINKLKIKRRDFFKILGLSSAAGLLSVPPFLNLEKSKKYNRISGKIVGANFKVGHLLRSKISQIPQRIEKMNTVIVGGGISGLSAAWKFKNNNKNDFLLLEMDNHTGGNSHSGENGISQFPWGAHYIPVPNFYDLNLKQLFEELGIITGYENDLPVINEYFLCADPEERLFFQGKWQDGLLPTHGVTDSDRSQYNDFFKMLEGFKGKKGSDGKYIFSIPLDLSSQDAEFLALDKLSMHDFLISRSWDSKPLHWYVNYCCRDDFGVSYKDVSAWAGIHYFSSRVGRCANSNTLSNITWPEGNGWLARRLKEKSIDHIKCNQLVYNIEVIDSKKVYIDSFDPNTSEYVRFEAENVIFCGPRYSAKHVIKNLNFEYADHLNYSPWLVANISLKERPKGNGHALSWDNVSYYSESLGYVLANHQDLKFNEHQTVITYYLPLDKLESKVTRHLALSRSFENWLEIILPDLENMHANITSDITNIDLWVWGHGMISPGINYLWSENRKEMKKSFGPIHFAHTDMSGISIFEEAFYRGTNAAEVILKKLKNE